MSTATFANVRANRRRATRSNDNSRAQTRAVWLMIAPALVLFLLFMAAPILYTLFISFQRTQVTGLYGGSRETIWVGFQNYVNALDTEFFASILRVIGYGFILVPVMLGLALLFALLLDSSRTRSKTFSRVAIFLPFAVPAVISSLLWGFLYLPSVSPFSYILNTLGIQSPDVLAPGVITFAIANIGIWGGTGFNMIVIYTSLKAVPTDIYEAARIDGATERQIAWRIKIPIVMPAIIMTFLFSMIATLQVFAEPMTLKPMTNSISSTWSPLMKIYSDAFQNSDIYSAAATSVLVAAGTLAISYFFLAVVQKRAFGQEEN